MRADHDLVVDRAQAAVREPRTISFADDSQTAECIQLAFSVHEPATSIVRASARYPVLVLDKFVQFLID